MSEPLVKPRYALEAVDLAKEYSTPGEPLRVLRGVTLRLGRGDSLAIVGPSGSGKSTLLNILGTLDRPSAGTVQLEGDDPFTLDVKSLASFRARKIGFVFQDHHLLPQCTALENVLLPKLALGRVGDGEIARARELLGQVGLGERMLHLPAELSGGERQRVAIARGVMNGPRLLLCDEPTGNLDSKSAAAVGELLVELARKTDAVLIVVTHSEALARRFTLRKQMVEGELVDES